MNRRELFRRTAAVGAAVMAAPMLNVGRCRLFAASRHEYSKRTIQLVEESLVIDMLGLLTLDWVKLERWELQPKAFQTADFRKLKSSGITVFNPAVDLNASTPEEAFGRTREWLRDWNVFLDTYPKELVKVENIAGLIQAKTQNKVGVVLGFQNSDHFRTLDDIGYFFKLGQRISQLTYNTPNQVGVGCTAWKDTGLTDFGVTVVREMNRLGMAVDVSHSGDATTMDAIDVSNRPVLITHANCRALNPRHPRCKPDELIRKMAARGGVMGITGIRGFVRNQEPTTIEDVLDHFDHVASLVGVEHLGIGSDNDLDGRDHMRTDYRMDIEGLDHPQRVFDLTEGLIRRKYSDRSIRLILGENFRRALAEIWTA